MQERNLLLDKVKNTLLHGEIALSSNQSRKTLYRKEKREKKERKEKKGKKEKKERNHLLDKVKNTLLNSEIALFFGSQLHALKEMLFVFNRLY